MCPICFFPLDVVSLCTTSYAILANILLFQRLSNLCPPTVKLISKGCWNYLHPAVEDIYLTEQMLAHRQAGISFPRRKGNYSALNVYFPICASKITQETSAIQNNSVILFSKNYHECENFCSYLYAIVKCARSMGTAVNQSN